jgi:hypothetical protein
MPYALFSNSAKVSKAYPAKSDVWRHAAESGLVMEVGLGEEDPPRRIMDMGYTIQECAADGENDASEAPGMSERDIAQLISACAVNPRSEAGAS